MTISILGTPYTVGIASESAEQRLEDCDGFCDDTTKEIVVKRYERGKKGDKGNLDLQEQKNIRHEIIHAFLLESGLAENSDWAQNEEMVDWIAKQGLKIYKAWREAGAI